MKSKFNPTQYMLIAYKKQMGDLYKDSFKSKDTAISNIKLQAFCSSLVSIMKFKGFNYRCALSQKEIDIFLNDTLMVSYDTSIVENIKNENSLKFQLFAEWGLLIELNEKDKALIAL